MTLLRPADPRERPVGSDATLGSTVRRRWGHRRAARAATLLGCLGAFAVLYVVAVRTGIGQRVDTTSVLRHHLDRTPDADVATSDHLLLLGTVALAPLVLWFGRRDRRTLVVNMCAVAASVVLAELSRELLHRPFLGPFDPLYGASFPSGHAAAVMALALALVAVADGTWVRRLVPAVPGFVAAFALAVPIHRPSDLIAGFVLALGVMAAAQWLVRPTGRPTVPSSASPRGWRAALLGCVGLTAVLLVAEAVFLRRAHLTLADLGAGFPIAVVAVVGVAELTVAAFRTARARL